MENTNVLEEEYGDSLAELEAVGDGPQKTPLIISWFRSNVASVTATSVDFMFTIFFTEIIGLWYVLSNAMGATAGGIVSFTMCRLWVFNRRTARWHHQAFRYVLAICLSLTLNTLGVWFLTETFHISYVISKVLSAGAVGVTVNFMMFRYFVFK
ncbi:MAG: GtrA family protein [Lewinellaceae bacterium]|nr:GtrA family protein [Lewinellaceae bacterium]